MHSTPITVQPLTPHVGAVLTGAHLSGSMLESSLLHVRGALDHHLVVVAKDQNLSPAELRDFTSSFGPPHVHHDDHGVLRAEGVPEVLEMRKEPDGDRLFGGREWHADVTFCKPAGYISVLHALVVPPIGGDTAYTSTIAAFQALTPAMQDLLRGLTAVHSYDGPGKPDHPLYTVTHPVVRTHPVTEAEGIYLNRMFCTRFVGMTEYESRPLIDFLHNHMTCPEFSCRISWDEGQVVMWDNRFTLHYPIDDFTGQPRLLIRCTALEA